MDKVASQDGIHGCAHEPDGDVYWVRQGHSRSWYIQKPWLSGALVGGYWRSAPATGMCGRLAGLGYSTQWFTLHEIRDLGRTEQAVASTGMCVGWYR